MNYITNILNEILEFTGRKESMELAKKVRTGKVKRSELEILSRGGPGISIREKRIARNAKKILSKKGMVK